MRLHFFIATLFVVSFLGCRKIPEPVPPEVGVTNVTFFSAKVSGALTGLNILDKGVCWGPSENPALNGNYKSCGSGPDPFEVQLTNLSSQVRYHVRTYVINESGTVYSRNVPFTTFAALGLTTNIVSSVSANSAVSTATIGSTVTFTPTERGVCWNTSGNPVITDNKLASSGGLGTSGFTVNLNNLSPNTTYHVRAYASSDLGIVYGNVVTFRTFGDQVTDLDGNKYNTVTIGNQVWMVENLKVTKYRNSQPVPYRSINNWNTAATSTLDAFGYFDDDASKRAKYGNYYNYLAISNTGKLAPEGWHIPTQAEFQTLFEYLGGINKAAPKLMSESKSEWTNSESTNESRFSALPGGSRDNSGYDGSLRACFWTSTPSGTNIMVVDLLAPGGSEILLSFRAEAKTDGNSVRCIKD